jgi:hypothetical protein
MFGMLLAVVMLVCAMALPASANALSLGSVIKFDDAKMGSSATLPVMKTDSKGNIVFDRNIVAKTVLVQPGSRVSFPQSNEAAPDGAVGSVPAVRLDALGDGTYGNERSVEWRFSTNNVDDNAWLSDTQTVTLVKVSSIYYLVKAATPITPTIEIANNGLAAYTGSPVKPAVSIYNGETLLKVKKDYTLSYESNVSEGTGYIVVTLADKYDHTFAPSADGAYLGSGTQIKIPFTIQKGVVELSVKNAFASYTGEAPSASIIKGTAKSGKTTLKGGTWSLVMSDGDYSVGAHKATVTYQKDGYQTTTKEITVTITPAKLAIKAFKLDDVYVSEAEDLDPSDLEDMIKESITFKSGNRDVVLSDEDFDIKVAVLPRNMDKKGTKSIAYTVTLNTGNYTFAGKDFKDGKAALKIVND